MNERMLHEMHWHGHNIVQSAVGSRQSLVAVDSLSRQSQSAVPVVSRSRQSQSTVQSKS